MRSLRGFKKPSLIPQLEFPSRRRAGRRCFPITVLRTLCDNASLLVSVPDRVTAILLTFASYPQAEALKTPRHLKEISNAVKTLTLSTLNKICLLNNSPKNLLSSRLFSSRSKNWHCHRGLSSEFNHKEYHKPIKANWIQSVMTGTATKGSSRCTKVIEICSSHPI